MALPPIERSTAQVARELTHLAGERTPAAVPVNPAGAPITSAVPSPGVIDMVVHRVDHAGGAGAWVYSNPTGQTVHSLDASASAQRDSTLKRPVHEKVQEPAPIPLGKILIGQVKALWRASASAVQVAQPVKDPLASAQTRPSHLPVIAATDHATTYPTDSK